MNTHKKISLIAGCTLEEAVEELLSYKKKGLKVYGIFNGHKLYSDTVTLDSAYKLVIGESKESLLQKEEQLKKELEDLTQQVKTMWIEKGTSILPEKNWEVWTELVSTKADDLHYAIMFDIVLKIEEILKKQTTQSFKEAQEILKAKNLPEITHSRVCLMIENLCTNGEDFIKDINK